MTQAKDKIQKELSRFTPEQRGVLQGVAEMRIQNQVYQKQLTDMKSAYDELYKIMIVLLHADPDHELRMHESHFLRFNEEYRIEREFDEETKEVVLKLKTLNDN